MDFFYNNQLAIDSLELANAWDYVKGTRDVLVGVMDTGIDGNHPDLSSLIVNDLCRDFTNGVETNQFINYRII